MDFLASQSRGTVHAITISRLLAHATLGSHGAISLGGVLRKNQAVLCRHGSCGADACVDKLVLDGRDHVELDAVLGRGRRGTDLSARQGLLARIARLGRALPARLAAEVPPPPSTAAARGGCAVPSHTVEAAGEVVVALAGGAVDVDNVAVAARDGGADKGELVEACVAHVLGRAEEHRRGPEDGVPEAVGAQRQAGDAVVRDAGTASSHGNESGNGQGAGAGNVDEGVDQESWMVTRGEIGLVGLYTSAWQVSRRSVLAPQRPEDHGV